MSTLHLIQSQINENEFLENLSRFTSPKDTLLFLNDSIYSLYQLVSQSENISHYVNALQIYAIDEQIESRGLSELLEVPQIKPIDYANFVELSDRSNKVISW